MTRKEELHARIAAAKEGKFLFLEYVREHKYLRLALYLPIFLLWFFVQEYFISSTDGCWVSYLPMDDSIPFIPAFIYAYVTWYPYLCIPALIFAMRDDGPAFVRYALYIIIGFSTCMLICAIWPNCQLLRPEIPDNGSFTMYLISRIYGADTPTNVLPSMHVVGCIGVMAACFDGMFLRRGRWPLVIWGVLICVSTVFVKQHSILDVFAGLALGAVLTVLLYGVFRKKIDRKFSAAKQP